MQRINYRYIFIISAFLLCNLQSHSQDTLSFTPQFEKGIYYIITSVYGTTFRGPVVEEGPKNIVILEKTTNSKHSLLKSNIKEVNISAASKASQVQRFDDTYFTNFYMISENALPFKKKVFNTTSHYFALNNLNYAFNEHFGVSMNLLVFIPSSIGVKCSFKIAENLYFGGNIYAYGVPGNNLNGFYCPLFGSAARLTKGDNVVNFSLGGGWMAVRNSNANSSVSQSDPYSPLYYLCFAYANRVSKHLALNIENFLFPQTVPYNQSSVNLNLTGISLKWVRSASDHWNFGLYGMYVGKFSSLNKNSQIVPLPYFGYTTFFD